MLAFYTKNIQEPREGDCGYDLRSNETYTLAPGEVRVFHIGTRVAIPEGHFGLIAERSSWGARAIAVRGGIIDPSYRGSIGATLHNLSPHSVTIQEGDRIAQLIVIPFVTPKIEEVDDMNELPATARGSNGFGSTGRK